MPQKANWVGGPLSHTCGLLLPWLLFAHTGLTGELHHLQHAPASASSSVAPLMPGKLQTHKAESYFLQASSCKGLHMLVTHTPGLGVTFMTQ